MTAFTMPAEVAGAINAVMAEIKTIGKDGKNTHQRYDFASADRFLAAVNPLCAGAGLVILQDEEHIDISTVETADDYGKMKSRSWLTARYSFLLAHKGGAMYGPLHRTVMVQANGAQAFGSAQSYALKQFLRSLFQISTGDDDDADSRPAEALPARDRAGNGQTKPKAAVSMPQRQAPPPPPHDAETGEVKPHRLAINPRADGDGTDWADFGRRLIAGLKSATSLAELDAWGMANGAALGNCERAAPKAYASIARCIEQRRTELAGPTGLPDSIEHGRRLPDSV